MPEVFLIRKSSINDFPDSWLVTEITHSHEKEFRNVFFFPVRVYYATRLTLQQLISFVIINWAKASLFFFYGDPVSEGYGAGTLYIKT